MLQNTRRPHFTMPGELTRPYVFVTVLHQARLPGHFSGNAPAFPPREDQMIGADKTAGMLTTIFFGGKRV